MRGRLAGFATAFLISGTAVAQEGFLQAVYLPAPELCEQAKAKGLQPLIEQGVTVLTARGLDTLEHNCRFMDVKTREGGKAWLAESFCEQPDTAYPELFALIEREPGRVEVSSIAARYQIGLGPAAPTGQDDGASDGASGGTDDGQTDSSGAGAENGPSAGGQPPAGGGVGLSLGGDSSADQSNADDGSDPGYDGSDDGPFEPYSFFACEGVAAP